MIQIHDATQSAPLEGLPELISRAYAHLNLEGRVSIRIGDEAEGKQLNLQYRGMDHATDVLSFPMSEALPDGLYLGDIFICLPVAEKNAAEDQRSLKTELVTLMIHGLLHLSGHDHEDDDGEMLRLQDELLTKLGFNSLS